ncbi:MAG TPA: glycosyltransferase family 1 protein, partial [Nevskiaceae bacterium]|nr:glycosyltransferase family 1 protein [Nevskiaceae bacterium]
ICVSGSSVPAPSIQRWLKESPNVSGIFMLHDLIPVTHPEYARPKMAARHRKYVEDLTRCASAVITNSQFTAESLSRFAADHGLKVPRTVVAPLGISPHFTRTQPKADLAPYFVFVGTIEPRKNHILLLQVWQRLVVQHGPAAPKLVIVGRRGWENENVLDLLDRGENLRSHVIECNQLCDELLIELIANARALLLPSHVEGYGLPVAEALALKTPVICSDLPPLREIAGDVPEYVDQLAGRGWARTIMDYADLQNPRRRAQVERMARFQAPLWKDHFRKIEDAMPNIGLCAEDGVPAAAQLVNLGASAPLAETAAVK